MLNELASGLIAGVLAIGGFLGIYDPQPQPTFGASVFTTQQGGTGTSTPSGILYGDGSTSTLKTVAIGSNLTFSGGILSASGGAAGTFGTTSITATAPLQWDTGTAVMSITQSGVATDGYLSSTDWNIFNDKVSSTSLSGTAPITYNSSSGAIGCNVASGSQAGCLSSTDWTAFNNKVSSSSLETNRDWQVVNGALTPTTTIGIIVNASSTIGGGGVTSGLTVSGTATTTNLNIVGLTGPSSLAIDANEHVYAAATTTFSTGLTYSPATNAVTVNTSQNIATLSNLTTNGFVQASGGVGTLGVQTFPCTIAQGCTAATSFTTSGNGVYYNGSALATAPLTSAVTYPYASSTAFSSIYASSTASFTGNLTISASGNLTITGKSDGCATFSSGVLNSTGSACGSGGSSSSKWATSTADSLAIYAHNALRVGIGTTTPRWALQVASSTGPQLTLSDSSSATLNHWSFRNAQGNLFISTSSPGTFATTATPALQINGSGSPQLGIGTTSPWAFLSLQPSAFSGPILSIGSSTLTNFLIDNRGFVGIATTSPTRAFTLDRIAASSMASSSISVSQYQPATTTSGTISPRDANTILWRLGTSATTLTLTNFQAGDQVKVVVCNPAAGTAGTITWATSPANALLWAGSAAPTQTTTANKCDVWSFIGTTGTSSLKVFGAQSANF